MTDTLIKRWYALWIRYPKRPKTKGDILRYALYIYLRDDYDGLCFAIEKAIEYYHCKYDFIAYNPHKMPEIFPLFNNETATHLFNGRNAGFWWPIDDYKNRYKYMKWLIKQYDGIKL